MNRQTRKVLDRSFTGLGFFSIFFLSASLVVVLAPIFARGINAFIFKGTSEFRRLNYEEFGRGDKQKLAEEMDKIRLYREPLARMLKDFTRQVRDESFPGSASYAGDVKVLNDLFKMLLGPGESEPVMMRARYGQTRWDGAQKVLQSILYKEEWDYSKAGKMGKKILKPRSEIYKGTSLEKFFPEMEKNLDKLLLPRLTFYWQFLTDSSRDSHFFGGIGAEVLGTFYLVLLTMVFAIPLGVIAAIYLAEFAHQGKIVSLLRVFISTLSGVPSIVFGLFGLAFFINTVKVSQSKSVLAGSLTLALVVLPTIIRAAEEAIKAVPNAYKEAALSLGAGKFRTVMSIILPSALPGILTGIVISMGRAAGETAPIIFTAAVSVGKPLTLIETLTQPSPALSWNIYNLVTEHEAVEQIRHVQFGMVFTLVLLVLVLNLGAILLRARIAKKLRG